MPSKDLSHMAPLHAESCALIMQSHKFRLGTEAELARLFRCPLPLQAYASGADFSGADLTNAVVDRVDFRKANLRNAIFANAVITGVQFDGANLEGALFEGALIGNEDAKRL